MALVALRRSGLLRLLSHPRLTRVRRSLLHTSGDGGTARVVVEVVGEGGARRAEIADPRGQSHLTCAGATIAVERALNLDGAGTEPPGVRLPERHADLDGAMDALRAHGVEL